MDAKPKHYAQGEKKGYQEGKRVGYEEGWKRGREEGRQELFAQGDEAFVRKLQEETRAAYQRGYEAGRREKAAVEYERGRKEGWEKGLHRRIRALLITATTPRKAPNAPPNGKAKPRTAPDS